MEKCLQYKYEAKKGCKAACMNNLWEKVDLDKALEVKKKKQTIL